MHLSIGQRVKVPFGDRNLKGVVFSLEKESHLPDERLRSILSTFDDDPPIARYMIELVNWISKYYHCQLIQSWRLLFPSGLLSTPSLKLLHENSLQINNWSLPPLNEYQQKVMDSLQSNDSKKKPMVTLLEGVTNSGKTRIYQHLAARAMTKNQQVLLLIPEIGLSSQNLKRFSNIFTGSVYLYHSGMTARDRAAAWKAALNGVSGVFIGTRSALFLPLSSPGIYILDEEHDASYINQNQPFYNTRNVLIMRSKLSNVPVLLGTATPSLEVLKHSLSNHYQHLRLTQKTYADKPIEIKLIDLRGAKNHGGVSPQMLTLMREHLENGNQVMLFLNRRGFAPVRICHECGHIEKCPKCDRSPTYHKKSNMLICHMCQWQKSIDDNCLQCDGNQFITLGHGTERVYSYIQKQFPNVEISQIDRDTIKNIAEFNTILSQIQENKIRIIIGTQMLSKGHHLPNLTLVGILDADQGLMSSDFRAHEHIGQQLEQVSGRSGRNKQGCVAIQTHQPRHPVITAWLRGGYYALSRKLLQQRFEAQLPPYWHQAVVRVESKDPTDASTYLNNLLQVLPQSNSLFISNPTIAPIEKISGRWRWLLMMEGNSRVALHNALRVARSHIDNSPHPKGLRCHIIVDPPTLS